MINVKIILVCSYKNLFFVWHCYSVVMVTIYFQDEIQVSASEFFDMELRPNLQPG